MYASAPAFFTPADSARAVADVYTVSLVATLPILAAMIAFLCLRHANAGVRAMVGRCTLAGLLVICAGRLVPWQWVAWVLPDLLARPLVALGTIQLDVSPGEIHAGGPVPGGSPTLDVLLVLYWSGVALVVLRTLLARLRLSIIRQRAVTLSGSRWTIGLREAGDAIGVDADGVQLLLAPQVPMPMTWGIRRSVVLLPGTARQWSADRLQAVLRHELAHVRARDSAIRLIARLACALFWFHPGVWWLARRLEADAEEACDDRVLMSGVRASDYAEWLAAAALDAHHRPEAAVAFARRSTLRARLTAVTDTRRRLAVPGRRVVLATTLMAAVFAGPLATARLAPTRDVLTSLMRDSRWESRAWAVVRLAQRADSVDVARTVMRHDPDPAVRAWARYALARSPAAPPARTRS
jgi:beta-lactamase regulating signal transducer with metallopeptidase domain